MDDLMVIRGQRIANQMLSETTYQELEKKTLTFNPPTKKRQYAVDPIQVNTLRFIPYQNSNTLEVRGVISSDGSRYDTVMFFSGVTFEPDNEPTNITFVATDDNEYNVKSIRLNDSNVKVRCSCLDFRWRFAKWNDKDNSLYGNPPRPYTPKGNRPPVNPQQVPGVCKHIIKTVIALKQSKIVV